MKKRVSSKVTIPEFNAAVGNKFKTALTLLEEWLHAQGDEPGALVGLSSVQNAINKLKHLEKTHILNAYDNGMFRIIQSAEEFYENRFTE